MQAEEVRQLLLDHLSDCEVQVQGEGNSFQIVAIGEMFAGLSAVKKQQAVYACLNPFLADGTIHAVTMKLYTPAEWDALS